MTRTLARALKNLMLLALVAGSLSAQPARAQFVTVYPPPDFIATATPEYYEGHPCYFWNGLWYWRGPGGWGMYREEPVFLRDRRVAHPPERRFYEGRPAYVRHEEPHRRR
jgi:hypothetical protein